MSTLQISSTAFAFIILGIYLHRTSPMFSLLSTKNEQIFKKFVKKKNEKKMEKNSEEKKSKIEDDSMLLSEQLSRSKQFLGDEGLNRLMTCKITVIGLGGVGSHAAHLLVRSGVRRIKLVDFDRVSLSSLNRHALATRSDVGLPKVTVMEHRLREFAGPGLECESINALCNVNNVESLIQGSDYVLDCIDDQGTKIDLLEACQRMNIKVICALGAGGKVDPTRICLGNLSDTSMDPMAQRLRAKIAHDRRLINMEDIEAVYSVEEPKATLLDLTEEQTINPEEFGAMPYFRVRIMPVLGTSPALFGISMAARVITNIAQHGMFTPIPVEGISKLLAHACSQRIRNQELKALGKGPDRFVDEDCMYVIAMCRKRCQITGSKMIGCGTERLELARWWSDRPLTIHNAILVRKDYVDKIYQYHAANRASGFAGPTAPRGHDLGCDDKVIKRIEQWLEAEKTVEFNM